MSRCGGADRTFGRCRSFGAGRNAVEGKTSGLLSRGGAGTLILLAFCIIVFLVIIGLFQYFAGSLTGTQRLRNAHSVSEAVLESALTELHHRLTSRLNAYPAGTADPLVAPLFDPANDGEEEIEICDRSFAVGEDGPDELKETARILKDFIRFGHPATVRVVATVKNWKPLVAGWTVEKRGILEIRASFEVGVFLRSAFLNEKARVWEMRRVLFCPPHRADQAAFLATNWAYYEHRFDNYVVQWTRFAAERAVAQDYVERAIGMKLGQALDSNDYFVKIKRARDNYPNPGRLDADLRAQLGGFYDRQHGKSKRLQKQFPADRTKAVDQMKTYLEACSDRLIDCQHLVQIRERVPGLSAETAPSFLEGDGLDRSIAQLVPPSRDGAGYNPSGPTTRLYQPRPSAEALSLKKIAETARDLKAKHLRWEAKGGGETAVRPVWVPGGRATAGEPLTGRDLSFVNMAQPFDAQGALGTGGYDKAREFASKIRIPPPLNRAAGEDLTCLAFGFYSDFEPTMSGGGGKFDFQADLVAYAGWEDSIRPDLEKFTNHGRSETERHRKLVQVAKEADRESLANMFRLLSTDTARRRSTHVFRDEVQYHRFLENLKPDGVDEVPLCGVYRVDGPVTSVLPTGCTAYTGCGWLQMKGDCKVGPVKASEDEKKLRDGNLIVQVLDGGKLTLQGGGEIRASILAADAAELTFAGGKPRIRGNLVVKDLHGTEAGPTKEDARPDGDKLFDCERLDEFEIVYDPALGYRPDGSTFDRKELVLIMSPCRSLQYGTVRRK